MEKFNDYLLDILSLDYDLVCFSETWLHHTECSQYDVQNYKCMNKPRSFIRNKAKLVESCNILYTTELQRVSL